MSWRLVMSWDAESDHFSTEIVAPPLISETARPSSPDLQLIPCALREEDQHRPAQPGDSSQPVARPRPG